MQSLNFSGFTKKQIIDVLHAKSGSRNIKFRYELLDRNDNKITDFYDVASGEVSMASFNTIKRTARFYIKDDGKIDFLNDRIKPYVMLDMGNEWIEWSLGIFLLSSPKTVEKNGKPYRSIEAFDGLQVLKDDKVDERYFIDVGANYTTQIISLLNSAGITKYNIESSSKTLPTAKEWDIGTDKLTIINNLLDEINFTQLWVDENGYYTSRQYISPSLRSAEYIYVDDDLSIICNGIQEELDLFSVPNKWIVVSSNPESEPLVATYINDNPNNILSTVSRGRTIVDYREINSIADQDTLNEYVKRIANGASEVYGHIEFETAIMPFHSYYDVIQVNYSSLGISDKFTETNWTIPLKAGSKMKHKARKVVKI